MRSSLQISSNTTPITATAERSAWLQRNDCYYMISLSHRFERFREKTKTRSFHEEKANCGREFDSLLQAKGLCTTEF